MSKKNQSVLHIKAHYKDVTKRLKRASGHLNKVISMIDENRKCIDISMQLHAVVKALIEAKKNLIHDHIEHYISDQNVNSSDLKEFKDITKFL